jgi:hypothetical protein
MLKIKAALRRDAGMGVKADYVFPNEGNHRKTGGLSANALFEQLLALVKLLIGHSIVTLRTAC